MKGDERRKKRGRKDREIKSYKVGKKGREKEKEDE